MWKCYLLETVSGPPKTYVGVTPDLDRRLRQHNGELSGGAKATHGRAWKRACHVTGFPDSRAALQFEWRWKQIARRQLGNPMERRARALQILLAMDRPTETAEPYSSWPAPPEVVWEEGACPAL